MSAAEELAPLPEREAFEAVKEGWEGRLVKAGFTASAFTLWCIEQLIVATFAGRAALAALTALGAIGEGMGMKKPYDALAGLELGWVSLAAPLRPYAPAVVACERSSAGALQLAPEGRAAAFRVIGEVLAEFLAQAHVRLHRTMSCNRGWPAPLRKAHGLLVAHLARELAKRSHGNLVLTPKLVERLAAYFGEGSEGSAASWTPAELHAVYAYEVGRFEVLADLRDDGAHPLERPAVLDPLLGHFIAGCPCESCVTCSCAVHVELNGAGRCRACGGVLVGVAEHFESVTGGLHVGVEVEKPEERAKIAVLIATRRAS